LIPFADDRYVWFDSMTAICCAVTDFQYSHRISWKAYSINVEKLLHFKQGAYKHKISCYSRLFATILSLMYFNAILTLFHQF
jgi:hypothetical protein